MIRGNPVENTAGTGPYYISSIPGSSGVTANPTIGAKSRLPEDRYQNHQTRHSPGADYQGDVDAPLTFRAFRWKTYH